MTFKPTSPNLLFWLWLLLLISCATASPMASSEPNASLPTPTTTRRPTTTPFPRAASTPAPTPARTPRVTITPESTATQHPPPPAISPIFDLGVDPRLELLAVVQLLSQYEAAFDLLTDFDFAYKEAVLIYFSSYREHAAVGLFDQLSQQGFHADAPPALMLHLSPPPDLELMHPLPEELLVRAGGAAAVEQFLTALRSFAVESAFMTFYAAQQDLYSQLSQELKLSSADIRILESYFGSRQHSYHIRLVPLYMAGGFGPSVAEANGRQRLYAISGPYAVKDGLPNFGSTDLIRQLAWHEFSHTFVAQMAESQPDLLNDYQSACAPIEKRMTEFGYGNWQSCLEEHIVRAVVVRLIAQLYGDEFGAQALDQELTNGFVFTAPLVDKLVIYETRREQYPTLADFYSELLTAFDAS